jgi:hypothetical protein
LELRIIEVQLYNFLNMQIYKTMNDKTKKYVMYGLGAVVLIGLGYYFYNQNKAIKAGITAENKSNRVVINKV